MLRLALALLTLPLLLSYSLQAVDSQWIESYVRERMVLDNLFGTIEGNDEDHCTWNGITCNAEWRVETLAVGENDTVIGTIPTDIGILDQMLYLSFNSSNLTGSIPASFGSLTSLRTLIMTSNQLIGSIPTEIGLLPDLEELDLTGNILTGALPTELGMLTLLTYINLATNVLSGRLPSELGLLTTMLEELIVDGNTISGSIPTEIGLLSDLEELDLTENRLTGTLPTELGMLTLLTYLHVGSNVLTGNLPSELGLLTNMLEELLVNENALVGTIPTEFSKLTAIRLLSLSGGAYYLDSWFQGNEFTGTIPTTLAELTKLTELILNKNQFTGTIPTELGFLSTLTILDLSYNQLGGSIPAELQYLSDTLTRLLLGANQLNGQLLSEFSALTNLESLMLGDNELTGSIPPEYGEMKAILSFELDKNKLTGTIPKELQNLSQMKKIRLEENELIGSIPSEFGNLSSIAAVLLGNNNLTGTIPTQQSWSSLRALKLGNNNLSGQIPTEFGTLSSTVLLELQGNNLSGPIPTELGALTSVNNLFLEYNQITGFVPSEFGNLESVLSICVQGNELIGGIPPSLGGLQKLSTLKVGSNALVGALPTEIGNLTQLVDLEMDYNNLTGHLPTELGMLTALENLNLTSNSLTGGLPTEIKSMNSLNFLDLSDNAFTGQVSMDLFELMQPMEVLNLGYNNLAFAMNDTFFDFIYATKIVNLSENTIEGIIALPTVKPKVYGTTELILNGHCLTGTIPSTVDDFFPRLEYLHLAASDDCIKCFDRSDSCFETGFVIDVGPVCCEGTPFCLEEDDFKKTSEGSEFACVTDSGLWGSIPAEISSFRDLKELDLSSNLLSGTIPVSIGSGGALPKMEILDLSSNRLTGEVPTSIAEIGEGNSVIKLRDNSFSHDSSNLLPYSLCAMDVFDLTGVSLYCPMERNALKLIFNDAKGQDWKENDNWEDEYIHHCEYYGVTCEDTDDGLIMTKLVLPDNGLSGKLSTSISRLTSLQVLELHDNDIRGEIPSEIVSLTNLYLLNLCYNGFRGEIPDGFEIIAKNLLGLVIHGNRLQGTIAGLDLASELTADDSPDDWARYIADCGRPSNLVSPISCPECTICCNSRGECESRFSETQNVFLEYDDFLNNETTFLRYSTWITISFASTGLLSLISFLIKKMCPHRQLQNVDASSFHETYRDSTFSLLLTDSPVGWILAVAVGIMQLLTYYIFFGESTLDLEDDNWYQSAWVYKLICPRDDIECKASVEVDELGWTVFGVLMALHLAIDIWNGFKIILTVSLMPWSWKNFRLFAMGSFLVTTSFVSVFVSVLFNIASATSNTVLIINAVILLFVNDIDELAAKFLATCARKWIEKIYKIETKKCEIDAPEESKSQKTLSSEVRSSHEEVESLKHQVKILQREFVKLRNEGGETSEKREVEKLGKLVRHLRKENAQLKKEFRILLNTLKNDDSSGSEVSDTVYSWD